MHRVVAKAHSNIALVKYWGKKDKELIIPFNSSISLTLNEFYTITEIEIIDSDKDEFILNDRIESKEETEKISKYIDLFRQMSNNNSSLRIRSTNYFPTAAGLASSASGYAALATGLNEIFQLNLDYEELSKMARRGSGSATRSIFGGLVEWIKGDSHDTSFARQIDFADWDIAMIAVLVSDKKKKVLSRAGMATTVATCPYYPAWVESAQEDVEKMKKAIEDRDLDQIGQIAEHSALKMHASMMATNPPIIYFEEESLTVIRLVQELRGEGILAYFTMDAGPNVKIITSSIFKDRIIEKLKQIVSPDRIVYSEAGPGVEILESD